MRPWRVYKVGLECILAGIGGMVEGGRGLGWGCGGDVDDEEEGCWRLKLSCENFVDFWCCGFFRLVGRGIFFVVEESFVALLVRMRMMGDAGGSAVEGSEVVCLLDRDCASQSVACCLAR